MNIWEYVYPTMGLVPGMLVNCVEQIDTVCLFDRWGLIDQKDKFFKVFIFVVKSVLNCLLCLKNHFILEYKNLEHQGKCLFRLRCRSKSTRPKSELHCRSKSAPPKAEFLYLQKALCRRSCGSLLFL